MSKKNLIIGGVVFIVLIGLFVLISTQKPSDSGSSQSNSSVANVAQNTNQPNTTFETIATVQDLKKRLDAKDPNEILVDVRTPEEFTAGHIQGAINIDIEDPNFISQIQKLDKSKTYIVFCRSGNRALAASQEMSKIGLKNVYSKGGITLWQTAGFEVVK